MRVLRPFLIAAVLCIPAVADQITVNNGDRLTGKVVTADEKAVILHTTYAGDIKIERSTIVAIESDEMLNITTKDAGSMKGKIAVSGTSANIAKADGTSVTATPGAITAIRNDEAQMAYEREQERLTRPRLNDFWSGFMALGVASAGGNSSTTAISTSASATRVAGKNKMVLSFAQLYATQRTTAPFGQTANKVSGAFRVDRDLTSRLFLYGLNSYDYDKFQNLDLRVVLGGGLGFHVWKSDRGYLDLALGGDWNREAFGAFNASPAFVRNSGELTVGEEAAYSVAKLKLFERFAVLPNLTSTGNYRMVFDSTASLPFAKWLEWNLGFTDRFLSNPPDGVKKNDTIFTMGVRFSFDQTKR